MPCQDEEYVIVFCLYYTVAIINTRITRSHLVILLSGNGLTDDVKVMSHILTLQIQKNSNNSFQGHFFFLSDRLCYTRDVVCLDIHNCRSVKINDCPIRLCYTRDIVCFDVHRGDFYSKNCCRTVRTGPK